MDGAHFSAFLILCLPHSPISIAQSLKANLTLDKTFSCQSQNEDLILGNVLNLDTSRGRPEPAEAEPACPGSREPI